MRRTVLAVTAATLLAAAGCSSDDTTTVVTETTSTTVTSTERTAGQPVQVDMYVRAVGEMYASSGQPAPSKTEALEFAASMCDFLDAGNSPYDAVQLLNEEGYPKAYTSEIVPKAIAAACTEHLDD